MAVVVCAPNAFKGTLSARRAAAAMAEGVRAAGHDAVEVPVADGGDGTLDVLLAAAGSRARVDTLDVTGPLGTPVRARLGWRDRQDAVVELAEASGLRLVAPGDERPLDATTRGTGELIRIALDAGARRIVVGVGGSATTDGGAGIASALGIRLLDAGGRPLPDGGGALRDLAGLDLSGRHPRLAGCHIEVAVDVASPLLGPTGAAAVFAPQKGSTPDGVAILEAGLGRLATVAERDAAAPPELRAAPGAGAAGGSGYGLAALCGAVLLPGAPLVCDLAGLDAALPGAVLVLTGEGRLDPSTAAGKAPREVARRARLAGIPCVALAGVVDQPVADVYAAAVAVCAGLTLDRARVEVEARLRASARAVVAAWAPRQ